MSALGNPAALVKALFARIPLILKTVLLHGIGHSTGSGKQDLRTELTVAIIRSFMSHGVPIGKQQKGTMRDPGIKGPLWVSKVTIPKPEIDVKEAVIRAIEELKSGDETYDIPGVGLVEAEWTGYRKGVQKNTPQPDISEADKYEQLKKDSSEDMVVLYFHGGAYYLMDPCTHRAAVSQISKRTGSPVLSVRYRLAPQNPFPAALVDALVAYLYLVSPPPGSLHAPVPPSKIILSGDSAGGNLATVLLQTLLTLNRLSHRTLFHGNKVLISPPGGLAVSSPWADVSRSMPSILKNALYDYLPVPLQTLNSDPSNPKKQQLPFKPPPIPSDEFWPASPPRVDYFVDAETIIHPLVSPLAAPAHLWKNAPPIFISTGEEGLADEGLILARKMHRAGAPVIAQQVEGMPHCFGLLMPGSTAGRAFYDDLGAFCSDAANGKIKGTSEGVGELEFVGFKPEKSWRVSLDKVEGLLEDEEVDEILRRAKEWRVEGEKELRRVWKAEGRARL
ncbi:Alpha/Beta hydrolase protein [Aspergillus pseudoustus]|uniref:Alpha/Beta hydrolase protein n=1 Tax=Aspergillus pseudoustus TaxID=1810923 RepID=A0ABR4KRF7_9EURO